MTDEEINKRIYKIMGLCWHEAGSGVMLISGQWCGRCVSCGKNLPKELFNNIDLVNTWQGFGILWEFIQKKDYKVKANFRDYVWSKLIGHGDWSDDLTDADAIPESLISPPAFAKVVVEFFNSY